MSLAYRALRVLRKIRCFCAVPLPRARKGRDGAQRPCTGSISPASENSHTLRLAAEQRDILVRHLVLVSSAVAFAWGGAEDEAAGLLEQLAEVNVGLAPAEITHDPLYSVPLADNARYRALSARLEVQIAVTNLR